jgi:hypothetical protein
VTKSMRSEFLEGELMGRGDLEDLGVNGTVISKWMLQE